MFKALVYTEYYILSTIPYEDRSDQDGPTKSCIMYMVIRRTYPAYI